MLKVAFLKKCLKDNFKYCVFLFPLLFFIDRDAGAVVFSSVPDESIISDEVVAKARALFEFELVAMVIEAQNAETERLEPADITALDAQWRAEVESRDKPLIARLLSNPLSLHLIQAQAHAQGLYSEIFVMDARGLNVGQSAITSDYWQGDEAKFQRTFPLGPRAVFIDDAIFHPSSATWRSQVSLTLADASGAAIGAAVVEINLTELDRRRRAGVWEAE